MTDAVSEQSIDPNNPWTIFAAVSMAVIGPIFFLLQPLYAGALADVLHFNAQEIGWLIGVEISGTAIASVLAFFFVRRLNWRVIVLFGLLAQAVCNLASCFVTGYVELLLLRLVTAVFGMGPVYVISIALLSVTARTGRNFSIVVFGQMSLSIVCLALLPQFIPQYGLGALFVPIAVIGLFACFLTKFIPTRSVTKASVESSSGTQGRSGPAIAVLWVQCLWYIGIAGVWTFIERIGIDAGIPAVDVGEALAVGMAVGLVGAVSSGFLTERYGRVLPFAVGMIFQVVAISFLFVNRDYSGFLIIICLYNVMWNLSLPPLFELMAAADSQLRFAVILPTAQAVALMVGAIVGGTLVHNYGFASVLTSGIVFTLGALTLFIWVSVRLDRQGTA